MSPLKLKTTKSSFLQAVCVGKLLNWCSNHKDVTVMSLQRRHNGRDGISNHQPHDCLLNRSFRCRSKKHQSCASLAFVRGILRGPVNSPHIWTVTRKMFPFDYAIMVKEAAMRFHFHGLKMWCRRKLNPGPFSRTLFPSSFKFGGNFVLLSLRILNRDR